MHTQGECILPKWLAYKLREYVDHCQCKQQQKAGCWHQVSLWMTKLCGRWLLMSKPTYHIGCYRTVEKDWIHQTSLLSWQFHCNKEAQFQNKQGKAQASSAYNWVEEHCQTCITHTDVQKGMGYLIWDKNKTLLVAILGHCISSIAAALLMPPPF